MPYIKKKRRQQLDPVLQRLFDELTRIGIKNGNIMPKTLDEIKGEVNYCFTKILISLLAKFDIRYHTLSNIHAIPIDVADEFKRVFMDTYENKKREESGEVKPLKAR